jgi:hypothetical protein
MKWLLFRPATASISRAIPPSPSTIGESGAAASMKRSTSARSRSATVTKTSRGCLGFETGVESDTRVVGGVLSVLPGILSI